MKQRLAVWVAGLCGVTGLVWAGTIDTDFIQQPWPKQWVHVYEVGRYQVRWRQRASKKDGLFAGVRAEVASSRSAVWGPANDYADLGRMMPGVTAVKVVDEGPNRHVIHVDIKVLWKQLHLTFEVEQDPPNAIRFRLANEALGEFRGVTTLEELPQDGTASQPSPKTVVEVSTWLKAAHPVPMRLLLYVERRSLLRGMRDFLRSCEQQRPKAS